MDERPRISCEPATVKHACPDDDEDAIVGRLARWSMSRVLLGSRRSPRHGFDAHELELVDLCGLPSSVTRVVRAEYFDDDTPVLATRIASRSMS
jgi:hypothetical protein